MAALTQNRTIAAALAAFAASGCAEGALTRIAPPGIIRYERIADEKEPNPELEARIAQARASQSKTFPKLGETAAAGPRPQRAGAGVVSGEVETLEARARRMRESVEADRDAAREDRRRGEAIVERATPDAGDAGDAGDADEASREDGAPIF